MPSLILGHGENNQFKKEITEEQSKNMIWNKYLGQKDPASTYENTKCTIQYQVNIFDEKEVEEKYNNITEAIIRLYNLKQIGIESANIFTIIRNGNKKIIIDDCIGCDLYDRLFNCDYSIRELLIENEALKIENKIYKDFLKRFKAEDTFEEFKKQLDNTGQI